MIAAMPATDPWSQFLSSLSKIIVPDWGSLISLLPFLLILLLVGPVLTLVVLLWLRFGLRHRSGKSRLSRVEVAAAERDVSGAPVVPPNTPFCVRDALIFPPGDRVCSVCRGELSVRCPVDGTLRSARQELCTACGTRYVLGGRPLLVARQSGPPPGGSAAA